MELHQLRYLVAVVDEGSFTAAAERAHVSQSGVSAQVAKLEQELGQRLLERGPRTLRLTAAGEAVLPIARSVLAGVARLAEVTDELSDLVRGRVRLGMIRGCSIPPFLDAVAGFRLAHPGVELALVEDDSDLLQRQVLAGDLDLALVGWAGELYEASKRPLSSTSRWSRSSQQGTRWPGAGRFTGRTWTASRCSVSTGAPGSGPPSTSLGQRRASGTGSTSRPAPPTRCSDSRPGAPGSRC